MVAALVHHHHPNNKNSLANVLRMLRHLGILTAWTVAVFVLCGASPTENVLHTVLASISFVTLGWFDTPALYGNYSHTTPPTTTQETAIKKSPLMGSSSMPLIDVWHQRLRGRHQDWMTTAQRQQLFLERCVFFSCIVCTIPCQILLLYDRGWQVQRWPCPVIIGSTIGWIVGVLLGAAHISLHQFNPTRFADKKLEDCPGVESTKDSHLPEAVDFVASDRHS